MLQALKDLGIQWELYQDKLTIIGKGTQDWIAPTSSIDCQNSATTMRLLAGALAATGTAAVLDGSQGLRRRPMNRITKPLRMMGVPISASPEGRAPLRLKARSSSQPLHGIDYELPVASAQVKTAILLAALMADSDTTIREPGPSRDHTERMLAAMGVKVNSESSTDGFSVTIAPLSQRSLSAVHMNIPGDFSSAAFLIVAALITPGSEIMVSNVGLNPTRTGLLDVLREMGAQIEIANQAEQHGEPVGDLTVRYSQLQGTEVTGATVVRMIDEFPIFAIAASSANGLTTVSDAIELRHKESDRIAVLCRNLKFLGIEVNELPDGFKIEGGKKFSGGRIEAHGDHRMAMAFAVAGLIAESSVSVKGSEMIDESFPGFTESLSSLGANIKLTQ
jgi:3-phosphoshikimate 1-carboxyvinyltransferase